MGRSARRLRKMGPAGLVDKRPGYVQLMKDGLSNLAACRILGIRRNTGSRWLNGRNGVAGLRQQGLDPRRRLPVPVASGFSRYLSEDERVFIADRLLARSSVRSIARELGRSPSTISRELARNRPDTRRYHPFRAQKMAQSRRPRTRLSKLAGEPPNYEPPNYMSDALKIGDLVPYPPPEGDRNTTTAAKSPTTTP